jgi:hypothetical protein
MARYSLSKDTLPDIDFRTTGRSYLGRRVFRLTHDYWVIRQIAGEESIAIRVPKDFETDFASIPRFAMWLVGPPAGKYAKSAVVHDYLYKKEAQVSRFLADAIFRDLMEAEGVEMWRRVVIYYAVRSFGAFAFGYNGQ